MSIDIARASLLAPECVGSGESDERSDVFMVAALLWHLATGKPLGTGSVKEHLASLRNGAWTPPALPSELLVKERPEGLAELFELSRK